MADLNKEEGKGTGDLWRDSRMAKVRVEPPCETAGWGGLG